MILRNVLVSQVFLFPWLALWVHDEMPKLVSRQPAPRSTFRQPAQKPSQDAPNAARPLAIGQRSEGQSALVVGPAMPYVAAPHSFSGVGLLPGPGALAEPQPLLATRQEGHRSFTGADLLGGSLTIKDLNRPALHPLALAEQARAIRLGDPFAPLPAPWQQPMRAAVTALQSGSHQATIAPARMVHLPSSRTSRPQQVPVVLQSDGSVDVLDRPAETAAVEEIRQWSSRQEPPAPGEIQPAVVTLEPMAVADAPVVQSSENASDPITGTSAAIDPVIGQ